MRVVKGYFLSSAAHPSGELMGPRAPEAPNAGVEDRLAGVAETTPALAVDGLGGGFAPTVAAA